MLRPGPALVLALALIASTRAFGADYYVKQGGDNNKTGLNSGQAWASLDRACGAGPTLAVAPGDTVHVAAGTYPGFVCDGLQALAGQFVKILSDTPGGAIFTDGSHPCAQFKNSQYIHFEAFAFGACSGSGVRVEASNHIEVVGCTFQGTGTNNSIAVVGSTAVLLHGNTISSAPGNGIGIATLAATRSSDVALEANRISRCGGAGLGIDGADNVTAINNLVFRNHSGGLVLTDGSLTALNNTVFQDTGDGWCLAVGASTNWLTSKDNILLNAGTNGAIKAADDNTVGKCASNANVLTDRFQIGPNWIQYTKWVNQAGTPDLLSGLSNAPTEFRDYASDNYHLAMGAKAIGKGVTVPGPPATPTFDIDGAPRTGVPPDIGAFVFVPYDAGLPPPPDAAVPPGEDAGPDAAQPAGEDAAQAAGEDASVPTEDSGEAPAPDAAPAEVDAHVPLADAAAAAAGPDATPSAGEDASAAADSWHLGGCGCSAAGPFATIAAAALLALFPLRRRRP